MWDDSTRVLLPGGEAVTGAPHYTPAYRATARETGYGDDVLLLCKEHELTHVSLCHWLGIESPTLMAVANRNTMWRDVFAFEEASVLAVQRLARELGIDLIKRALLTADRD